MRLCDIKPDEKTIKKKRKRIGRGNGSGYGTTCGRGTKGQLSRSGKKIRIGFEGGQMPLSRRIPHLRGFKNTRKKVINILNVRDLDKFKENDVIDYQYLHKKGLIMKEDRPLKILGSGKLEKRLTVRANFFSKSAAKKIEDAGGKVEVIS